MPKTKEEKAAYWKEYASKNRDRLREKHKKLYYENLIENRRKNAERMKRVYSIKRGESEEERLKLKAQRDALAAEKKAFKKTPKYKASIRIAKNSISQSNHQKFPDRPRKRGEIREDGMIFWRYSMELKAITVNDLEVWMTPEEFELKAKVDRERAIARIRNNPQRAEQDHKRFRQNNPTHYRDYLRNKQANDPLYVIAHRCRSTIQSIIRRRGWEKVCKTNEILGCDWKTLKLHLENQFLKGMNWDNRNLWHIDHYHPLADAQSIEDVIRLNHYTNLRPMWAKDNQKKSSSLCPKGHQIPLLLNH